MGKGASMQAARAEAILCNMLVDHNLPFFLMCKCKTVKCAKTKLIAVVYLAIDPDIKCSSLRSTSHLRLDS